MTDTYNATIRMIAPDVMVSTQAGTAGISGFKDGIGSPAEFSNPIGILVDGSGNLYVSDNYNHRIRKIAIE